ncbi:MAG: hypothetical protein UZ21_OP11001000400 [Microgenomates bacterium OLB22]|nr:MAG: hypothetical protein UZ21_OP11001000400 [Microgenomates bacterium OLB22]
MIERTSVPPRDEILSLVEQRAIFNILQGFVDPQEGFRFSIHHTRAGLSITPTFGEYLCAISGIRGRGRIADEIVPALAASTAYEGKVPELIFQAAHIEDLLIILTTAQRIEGVERGLYPSQKRMVRYRSDSCTLSDKALLETYAYLAGHSSLLFRMGQEVQGGARVRINDYAHHILEHRQFVPAVHNVAMQGKGLPRRHSVESLALLLHRMMQLRLQQKCGHMAHFDFEFS